MLYKIPLQQLSETDGKLDRVQGRGERPVGEPDLFSLLGLGELADLHPDLPENTSQRHLELHHGQSASWAVSRATAER